VKHISILNHLPGRSIDFDVLISSDLTVFDGIYTDEKVLSAGVRKWKKHFAKRVEDGSLEVRCTIFDRNGTRSFSVEEMKKTSTQELANQLSMPLETIMLVLQWDETEKYEPHKSEAGSCLKFQITNEATGWTGILELPISAKLSLYDGIYGSTVANVTGFRDWPKSIAD